MKNLMVPSGPHPVMDFLKCLDVTISTAIQIPAEDLIRINRIVISNFCSVENLEEDKL